MNKLYLVKVQATKPVDIVVYAQNPDEAHDIVCDGEARLEFLEVCRYEANLKTQFVEIRSIDDLLANSDGRIDPQDYIPYNLDCDKTIIEILAEKEGQEQGEQEVIDEGLLSLGDIRFELVSSEAGTNPNTQAVSLCLPSCGQGIRFTPYIDLDAEGNDIVRIRCTRIKDRTD